MHTMHTTTASTVRKWVGALSPISVRQAVHALVMEEDYELHEAVGAVSDALEAGVVRMDQTEYVGCLELA